MFRNDYLKSFFITILYYILTSGLSILAYLTVGKYLIENHPSYFSLTNLFIYLVTLFIVLFFFKKKKESVFNQNNISIKALVAVLIIGVTFRIFIDPLYRINILLEDSRFPNIMERTIPLNEKFVTFFNIVILAPIMEEIIFRENIFKSLMKKNTILLSAFLSSLFFALIHISIYPFSLNLIGVISAFLIGITSCSIYLKYGLFYSIVFHSFLNLLWFLLNFIFKKKYWDVIIYLNFNVFYWILVLLVFLLLFLFNKDSLDNKEN